MRSETGTRALCRVFKAAELSRSFIFKFHIAMLKHFPRFSILVRLAGLLPLIRPCRLSHAAAPALSERLVG